MTAFTLAQEGQITVIRWTYYHNDDFVLVTISPGVDGTTFAMIIGK